ncbi:iron-sulfur cluster assembly scaffold protein [Candidatus Babeliales bacterium]|nr:iron-sulfur cluster assembly scaffold protein [Candidatus Babeliales bacterium]
MTSKSDSLSRSLYNERIVDYFRNPRYYGTVAHPDFFALASDETCGDSIAYQGKIEDGIVSEIAFTGKGCMISQATASLLAEAIIGKPVVEIQRMDETSIRELIQLNLGPNRIRCALLALKALHRGLSDYEKKAV